MLPMYPNALNFSFKMNAYFFITFSIILINVKCKVFTRPELAEELLRQGFQRDRLDDWLCLIEAESAGRTDAIGGPDEDGSFDHGLFQINDRFWCSSTPKPGLECNITCEDLRTNDITKSSICAKKIYNIHGFFAWVGWKNECRSLKKILT